MDCIVVGDISVEVVKKNIKNIHLTVYPPNGNVRLASPLEVSRETIRLFIISKLSWIKSQRRKLEQQERQSPREFVERESHYFLGKRYLLRVSEVNAAPKVLLTNKNFLDLHIRPNTPVRQRQIILNEWYRAQLKDLFPPMVQKWEKIMDVQVHEWAVKQMKTKWGTCNTDAKRIWLNLELAKKPVHCLEYIIVHEMVHLLERNHNDRFLAYMNHFMPHWQHYREELNRLPISHTDWNY